MTDDDTDEKFKQRADELNRVLEEGMVDEIEFLEIDPAWYAPMPRLAGQVVLEWADSEPKPKFKCKHPSSFTHWDHDGRWCDKCTTRIAPPR